MVYLKANAIASNMILGSRGSGPLLKQPSKSGCSTDARVSGQFNCQQREERRARVCRGIGSSTGRLGIGKIVLNPLSILSVSAARLAFNPPWQQPLMLSQRVAQYLEQRYVCLRPSWSDIPKLLMPLRDQKRN